MSCRPMDIATPHREPMGRIEEVRIGRPQPLAGRTMMTAYAKQPVVGPVHVTRLGIEGDSQVNRKYHGGPEKAVYGYPLSGYAGWRADFSRAADRFGPGAMGENLVVTGQDEASLHLGDIVRTGTATLQVAQIREPCSTMTAVLGLPAAARAMTRSGRCGWYYRVLADGVVASGDDHLVIDRPNPRWPIARFAPIAAGRAGTHDELAELARLPGLSPDWQARMAERLARRRGRP